MTTTKILTISLDGLDPDFLLAENSFSEKLVHFHQLMDMGFFGKIERPPKTGQQDAFLLADLPIWEGNQKSVNCAEIPETLLGAGESLVDRMIARGRGCFHEMISIVASPDWNYLEFHDVGLERIKRSLGDAASGNTGGDVDLSIEEQTYILFLDGQLGQLFENIRDDLILAIISSPGTSRAETGAFIIAAPKNPLSGGVEQVNFSELTATLLELGGYDIARLNLGKSLVDGLVDAEFFRSIVPGG